MFLQQSLFGQNFDNQERDIHPGMGQAVAERTILRKDKNGKLETWKDVSDRVALGNSMLFNSDDHPSNSEFEALQKHLRKANTLMSGRHLQHGDFNQHQRNMEVHTNCCRGNTKIITLEYGSEEIVNLMDKIVTVRCVDGKWRKARVKSYGKQDLFKLSFRKIGGGYSIKRDEFFTRNHRWILQNQTVTTDIQVGDRLTTLLPETNYLPEAVIHGIIFGDGSAHKTRTDYDLKTVSQGRTYADIRVCKQDVCQDEICSWLDKGGYIKRFPRHANGDPVYYIGKKEFIKDLPFTNDPEYIAGFIHGWWLADGSKGEIDKIVSISTTNKEAVEWLRDYAAYAGLTIISEKEYPRKEGDGSYPNAKPLHWVRMHRGDVVWEVDSIEPFSSDELVYCVEEPTTKSFTLSSGLVTGNCSTSAASFMLFYLLLNGSGVGRSYDDDMVLVDWDNSPNLICVLDSNHPNFDYSAHESKRDAEHKYGRSPFGIEYSKTSKDIIWYEIPDTREGWAKALEMWEILTFEKIHRNKILILDFSKIRAQGTPIKGMQSRPASGPVPLINAFTKAATVKGGGMPMWKQAMYIDHYFAECVLVGGARRAARMSTKSWRDTSVLDFITIKRPLEYNDMTPDQIAEYRKTSSALGFLWSSNNSVIVDKEFWILVEDKSDQSDLAIHARKVFELICEASYADGTGEPGLINGDKLTQKDDGWTDLKRGDYIGSTLYQVSDSTDIYLSKLAKAAQQKKYHMIVNPCGEIVLNILGGFCVIADVVPYHASSLDEAEEAFRTVTRSLIRVNMMDSIYKKEVLRTNRIGVGITGIHEFAYKFFGYGFKDLIDEENSRDFWQTLSRFNRAVYEEAVIYSKECGVTVPHTMTTIKPAGTTSKLFLLTEGWHLPSMKQFLRWVQFRNDDPLVEKYKKAGYPVRDLVQYQNTTIVGFPTAPVITTLGMGDKLITAAEATPEEQYKWLMLGEKYWVDGFDPVTQQVYPENYGNQISYTLKYNPELVDFENFRAMLLKYQPLIKCCSVMPQSDTTSYEYQPEQPVSEEEFTEIASKIIPIEEDVGKEHVLCDGGACPIDFKEGTK